MNDRTGSPRRRDPRRVPRVLAAGEELPPIPLCDMDDDLLCEAVSRDVRGRLDQEQARELRGQDLKERWVEALERLRDDVDAQLEGSNKGDEWQHKARTFRRAIERRLDEAGGRASRRESRSGRSSERDGRGASRGSSRVGAGQRIRELEAAIVAHRDHECDPSCDEGCPADDALWSMVSPER